MSENAKPGRVVTFYSYKGGTGRSMAVANAAWILATNGKRVLVIDWDLEAPGLHRYFHPFLEDKELSDSPGLIDYFVDFATEARIAAQATSKDWQERYLDLLGYVRTLETTFGEVSIDFVPAGKQSAAYAVRVNTFDWQEFYTKLGGGVLLEALKGRLRQQYDFILIDSRTGISDTSSICTVQMPDDLVVCYTLNRQSVRGAAAVARSAFEQRRKPDTEPTLRVWPLATRIELAEKDRLEEARQVARAEFEMFVMHLNRKDREYYWGRAEVLYQPYFAYEEVLSVFADKRHQTNSMLAAFESLVSYLTDDEVRELGPMSEEQRQSVLRLYVPDRPPAPKSPTLGKVFINYHGHDAPAVERLVEAFDRLLPDVLLWQKRLLRLGDNIEKVLGAARESASIFLVIYGPGRLKATPNAYVERELMQIVQSGKPVIPVILSGVTWNSLPDELRQFSGTFIDMNYDNQIENFIHQISELLRDTAVPVATQIDDPQKGQWGGKSSRNGRTLSATVEPITDDWFEVTLRVQGSTPLTDPVTFYIHPSFSPSEYTVHPVDGAAILQIGAWGAFTLGAVADGGRTVLELDLAELSTAPQKFRER